MTSPLVKNLGLAACVGLIACNAAKAPRLRSDTLFGVYVGMQPSELENGFRPKTPGKWMALESTLGESRARWQPIGTDAEPLGFEVTFDAHGARDLIFTLRKADIPRVLGEMGAALPNGLTRLEGPHGTVIVSP